MRFSAWFASLLLLSGSAMGGGTVNFNLNSYPTSGSGGVVIADFNRDGIPDVAYTVLGNGVVQVVVKW